MSSNELGEVLETVVSTDPNIKQLDSSIYLYEQLPIFGVHPGGREGAGLNRA